MELLVNSFSLTFLSLSPPFFPSATLCSDYNWWDCNRTCWATYTSALLLCLLKITKSSPYQWFCCLKMNGIWKCDNVYLVSCHAKVVLCGCHCWSPKLNMDKRRKGNKRFPFQVMLIYYWIFSSLLDYRTLQYYTYFVYLLP